MIIGKERKRVRRLELQCKQAYELIEELRNDMEIACDRIHQTNDHDLIADVGTFILAADIGKCSWYLHRFK